MILAVPPDNWERLRTLCAGEDVEAMVLGHFEKTGRLKLSYQGQSVGDLAMSFLHDGRPDVVRKATWRSRYGEPPALAGGASSATLSPR